jgi:hypothetical protein
MLSLDQTDLGDRFAILMLAWILHKKSGGTF